jgi:hypothetical protein
VSFLFYTVIYKTITSESICHKEELLGMRYLPLYYAYIHIKEFKDFLGEIPCKGLTLFIQYRARATSKSPNHLKLYNSNNYVVFLLPL